MKWKDSWNELLLTKSRNIFFRCREKEQSKTEISSLMQRLQAAEARCDELSQVTYFYLTIWTKDWNFKLYFIYLKIILKSGGHHNSND